MDWSNTIKDYKIYLKLERSLSANSITSYSLDIEKLRAYVLDHKIKVSPITISKEDLTLFIYNAAKYLNPRSQSRLISSLKGFFNYLIFEDYRLDNPTDTFESPKIGRKLPDTISTDDIDNLIAAIDYSKKEAERNKAILETLYGCGLRVSELTGLKLSDLYFKEGFIKVTGKGNKQRFVPITTTTINYILNYIENSRSLLNISPEFTDIVFLNRRGKQLTRAMIFTIIKQLAVKINLNKTISPHTFRHSFATHLLENGADLRAIQQMLGHESITTTEIYVHLDNSFLKKVVELHHPRSNLNLKEEEE